MNRELMLERLRSIKNVLVNSRCNQKILIAKEMYDNHDCKARINSNMSASLAKYIVDKKLIDIAPEIHEEEHDDPGPYFSFRVPIVGRTNVMTDTQANYLLDVLNKCIEEVFFEQTRDLASYKDKERT